MSNFTKPLDVRYLNGTDYLLLESFEFYFFKHLSNSEFISDIESIPMEERDNYIKCWLKVPSRFITDFASLPAVLLPFISKTGAHGKAAVLHDYMYKCATQDILQVEGEYLTLSQKEADDIFRMAMEVLSVNSIKKHIMYKGVRIFGDKVFDKYAVHNAFLPEFRIGQSVVALDLRLFDNLIPNLRIEDINRNLIKFEGLDTYYLSLNFEPL